jgi:predicted ATPase
MERAAGLAHGDAVQVKLDKLDTLLAQSSTSKQDAALFAEMLSLPNDGRYPALNMDPQQRRQKTLAGLTAQIEALSRQNPVLMIFEDAHWTDPTSLETFGRVVDRVRSLPVRSRDISSRVRSALIGYLMAAHHQSAGAARHQTMIDRVVGNKPSPRRRKDIIERTDGIPCLWRR